ncbi:MAG: LamG domain-containing protein, partial [Planctomycetes bacterium]|nr:LamG domain-containing protein [Planctomycetota bacterium]
MLVVAVITLVCAPAANARAADETDSPPWQSAYTGQEATGANVIALWQFSPGAEAEDGSGNGHQLALRGESRFIAEGRFGGGLESMAADEENDHAQGALAKDHPALSPPGAFTLDLWIKPKPETDDYATVFLLDKKYFHYAKDLPQANCDYCLFMRRAGENRRRIVAYLGFGADSATYTSDQVDLEPNAWSHVAFTYDGAGTGRFFVGGKPVGRTTHEGRGAVTPGSYGLVIGCRYGSVHNGFPGTIDEVRISRGVVPFFSGAVEVDVPGARTAFLRMEQNARVPLAILNDTGKRLTGGVVRISSGGGDKEVALPELAPDATHTVEVAVDTTLRPNTYPLRVSVSASAETRQYEVEKEVPVVIVPRRPPGRMPVVMWGSGDLDTLAEIGFTHQIVYMVDYGQVWAAGEPTEAVSAGRMNELAKVLDEHLVRGMGAVTNPYPGRWIMRNKKLAEQYQRVDRAGEPYDHENACTSFPEIQTFGYNVGASIART